MENNCLRIEAIGVLCGDKPRIICDWKALERKADDESRNGRPTSLQFKEFDYQFRRNSDNESLGYLKQNKTFIRVHNITFDRYLFLTRKQQKEEPIESHLKELSENCDLGEKGDTIIRDVFIANMQNEDIQKELLKETVEPDKAMAIAINI